MSKQKAADITAIGYVTSIKYMNFSNCCDFNSGVREEAREKKKNIIIFFLYLCSTVSCMIWLAMKDLSQTVCNFMLNRLPFVIHFNNTHSEWITFIMSQSSLRCLCSASWVQFCNHWCSNTSLKNSERLTCFCALETWFVTLETCLDLHTILYYTYFQLTTDFLYFHM